MADLIMVQQALSALPTLTPAQQSNVATLVSQASAIAERYCNRKFLAQNYDEIHDSSVSDAIILRRFPVNYVTRISASPYPILKISNSQGIVGVPRATAGLLTTGTIDTGLTVTGVNLSWWVAGVQQTVTVPTASYPTIGQLAAAISAVGNGWQATCEPTYQNWPTSDLAAPQGMGSASMEETWISAYIYDLKNFTIDPYTGEIRMQDWPRLGPWFPSTYPWDLPWGTAGWRTVRVLYNAGFTNVPADVQSAVTLIVRHLFQLSQNYSIYKREKLFDYEYEMEKPDWIPEAAVKILNFYRDWRASGTI